MGRIARARDRMLAAAYDPLLADAERTWLGALRRDLLAGASGRVLEVGAGTGANLPHLPPGLDDVLLVEPSPAMRTRLSRRLATTSAGRADARADAGGGRIRVREGRADALPVPDASVDTVIATLVLCSVRDPAAALAEVRRVLAPGGRLLLLEHVRGHGAAAAVQRALDPAWRVLAGGCRLVRDTRAALEDAGFDTQGVADVRLPLGGPLRPALHGAAVVRTAG